MRKNFSGQDSEKSDEKKINKDVKKKDLGNRILEIDVLRAIAVLLMIFDHFMFDVFGLLPELFENFPLANTGWANFVDFASFYWDWNVRIIVRYAVIFIFLGITGICCSFSKSNLARGLKLFALAMGLTLVTFIIGKIIGDPDITITFGILHAISVTLIIVGLLEKLKTDKWVYLAIGIVSTAVGIYFMAKDPVWYSFGYGNDFVLILKQIVGTAECGGDTAPLFLNGGQIFIGVFIGRTLYRDKKSLFGFRYSNNPLTFIGRNSIWVYFAHQIIIPVILGLVLLISGYKLMF